MKSQAFVLILGTVFWKQWFRLQTELHQTIAEYREAAKSFFRYQV